MTDKKIPDEMMTIAESIFGTSNDPDQMSISLDSRNKLGALNENCILYEENNKGDLISWIVILPTSKELMIKFLSKEISEQNLLDFSKKEKKYSALYLCSAITIPEYRNRGHALRLFKEVLARMPLTENFELFAWPTTPEGNALIARLSQELGVNIHTRK